ncbi:MAG: ABC transporter permease [Bacilli bacterium]|nr:ABC transporter permease [Bacilli bacterium]
MLRKKRIRDIKQNLSQFITIFLMIFIGVMAYSGIEAYMQGMKDTADRFYGENNLQDLNVLGTNFSMDDLNQIKKIEHVKNAERKLSVTGTTSEDKTLLINFIEENDISRFYVVEGEKFDASKSGVYLDEFYARENNIKLGDTIKVKYDSLELEEKVLALINVPDHLYDTRDESELYPNRTEFGFAYLSASEISESFIKNLVMKNLGIEDEKLFDQMSPDFHYQDYIPYNTIMVDVEEEESKEQVKQSIEEKIEHALAVMDIKNTSSYVTYQGEIDEGKTYVGVFSGLFLFIAMLSVITTMTRVIQKEQVQIGTLKALGFSNFKVLTHYIGYGFWIALVASLLGLIAGYFLIGNVFIGLEMAFFEIPNGAPSMHSSSYLVAILVVLIVSFITYLTGKKILRENPAETLRTKIPSVKKNSLNFTNQSFFQKFSFSTKWNLRDMIRNKMRTFMGLAGVVGCCMLIVCALGMLDSMNYFVDLQFKQLYHFNYKLNLKEDITDKELQTLKEKYGNKTSKTYGIEIKNGEKKEANNIFITDAKDYVQFVDNKGKIIELDSKEGVYVTYKLASTKGYKLGDELIWHIYGEEKYYTSTIVGFNKDPQNQNMTMTKEYFESLGKEYQPDALYTNVNLENQKNIEGTSTVQDIHSLEEGMEGMLSMMKTMLVLIISIAVILGSIIIYNLGILSYSEKQYQFATLKVLGFDDKRIQKLFIKQNNWIAILSIIIGLPLGYYLTDWLFKTAIEEHYDFGASITIVTYLIASVGTFLVSILVSKFLSRKVKSIDMVSSLKGNE